MRDKRTLRDSKNNGTKSRLTPGLLILLALALLFFLLSDSASVRNARDAVFGRQASVSEDGSGSGRLSADGADGSEAATAADEESGSLIKAGKALDDGKINNAESIVTGALPEYDGHNYVSVNGNVPLFPDDVYERAGLIKDGGSWKTEGNLFGTIDSRRLVPYEYYGSTDTLGRCTEAYGCLGEETMPEEGEERGDISQIHPSGWAKAQHWERCHLIAWALGAENANPANLITGTHYLNYDGMRPFEEETERYIWNTGNHVLYMVRPWFADDELVARGVQMCAMSLEDGGKGVSFNIYCFNVTPGAAIDYRSGIVTTEEQANQDARSYIVNKRSGMFHYPSCDGAKSMNRNNREEVNATRSELIARGYTPCGLCEP